MKRMKVVLAALVLGAALTVGAAAPAQASSHCTGVGNMHMSAQFGVYVVHPDTAANFSFQSTIAAGCGSFSMSGSVNGSCGRGFGTGIANMDGTSRSFQVQWHGTVWVFTGSGIVGTLKATPNALTGDSCFSKTADDHLVQFAAAMF